MAMESRSPYSASRPKEEATEETIMETILDLAMDTIGQTYRQRSVLETPPIISETAPMVFPNYHGSMNSMESGLFNSVSSFSMQSNKVVPAVLESDPDLALSNSVSNSIQPQAVTVTPISADVIAPSVYTSFDPDILLENNDVDRNKHDPRMPIVHTLSHDHSYVNNSGDIGGGQDDDYDILRDFLIVGDDIVSAGNFSQEELNIINDSYLDTYGDLTNLLNEPQQNQETHPDVKSPTQQEVVEQIQDEIVEYEPVNFVYSAPSPEADSISNYSYATSTTPQPFFEFKPGKSGKILVKDEKYWERRKKNNVASARSRKTRKERAMEMDLERQSLEIKNCQLRAEVARLQKQVNDHKTRFFAVFKK